MSIAHADLCSVAPLLCLFVWAAMLPAQERERPTEDLSQTRQDPAPAVDKDSKTSARPSDDSTDARSRSGYDDVPEFGGPSSVGGQLKDDDEVKKTVFRLDYLQRGLKPYFEFKGTVKEKLGLALGSDYTILYQGDVSSGDDAAGGILRFFGTWTLFGIDSGNTGSFIYKVENRHRVGTDIAPQDLGFDTGYAGLTAAPFTDYDWGLTNFYWQQKLLKGRISFVVGLLDATDYVDIYGLVNPWTAFSNLAFSTDPTIPVPNQGLGAALGVMITDNIYLTGGLADANGDPTDPLEGFDTFFEDNEYFSHVELGWTSSRERIYLDNLHVTAWHANEREDAGVLDGWGLAGSLAWFVDDTWMPFLRGGYAEDGGALWEGSVSTGIGYYLKKRGDLLGFGFNWCRPSETAVGPGLDDQYAMELFYRIQLSQNFALTPDAQVLIDPALNPDDDVLGVLGIRARLSF